MHAEEIVSRWTQPRPAAFLLGDGNVWERIAVLAIVAACAVIACGGLGFLLIEAFADVEERHHDADAP